MKTIGMIGGVSWESTLLYYKLLNEAVRARLGNLNSAKLLLYSINYEPIVRLEQQGRWGEVADEIVHAAMSLQKAGAELIILCCNTLHKVTPAVEAALSVPFLHIADAAGTMLKRDCVQKIGLLGTQFTMEDGFYASRLQERFGLEVIVPEAQDRKRMDALIYDELCQGKVLTSSKEEAIRMIRELKAAGAEAILLGCTELGLLIRTEDVDIPLYDTTLLHVEETLANVLNQP